MVKSFFCNIYQKVFWENLKKENDWRPIFLHYILKLVLLVTRYPVWCPTLKVNKVKTFNSVSNYLHLGHSIFMLPNRPNVYNLQFI